jgi:hypothetical protein
VLFVNTLNAAHNYACEPFVTKLDGAVFGYAMKKRQQKKEDEERSLSALNKRLLNPKFLAFLENFEKELDSKKDLMDSPSQSSSFEC